MENKDFIIEKDGKQLVDVVKLLPDSLPSGKKILWRRVDEKRIEVFVDKNSARGGNTKPIVIKRFIEINELLFEGFGLRLGDGLRLQGGVPRVFGFSNTNIQLVNKFLEFSTKLFGINSNKFRVALTIPPLLSNKTIEEEKKISNGLNIPLENFFKTRILERSKSLIINVRIISILFSQIINLTFDNLQNILFSNKNFCAGVLRGLIASEANVCLRGKNRRLGEITIAGKAKDKREFMRKLLFKLDVIPDRDKEIEGQECVLVTGLSNFKKFDEWKLVCLQPNKSRDFEFGIKNFTKEEFRKGEGKLLTLQSLKERPKRAFELGKELNRTQKAINWTMNKLEKRKLVESFRISKNIFWKLTDEGLNLINNGVTFEQLKNNKFTLP